MSDVLRDLAEVIEARKNAPAAESYVASLYAGGIDAILRKVGEEAIEVVIAGKDGDLAVSYTHLTLPTKRIV